MDDQREASGRTDVLTFTSDLLTVPLKISGTPVVHLVASTIGTDSDWVYSRIPAGASHHGAGAIELVSAL